MTSGQVADLVGLVVAHLGDGRRRWSAAGGPERLHQRQDLVEPLAALVGLVDQVFAVMANVDVEVVEVFHDRLLAVLHGRRQLGEEEGGHGGVLVAGMGALQVPMRFLEAEEKTGESRLVDPLGDPLEADEQVVLGADSLALGEGLGHLAGDQRCDQVVVGPGVVPGPRSP